MTRCSPFVLIVGLVLLTPQVHGGEPHRCLRDGKVIITDVSCELLGNATDLTPPLPDKHFQRGEPEATTKAKSGPIPDPTNPTIAIQPAQTQSSKLIEQHLLQMLGQVFATLFLPAMVVMSLVAWFTRRTKRAAKRYAGAILRDIAQKASDMPQPMPASTGNGDTNQDQSWRIDPVIAPPLSKPKTWTLDLIRELEWKRFEDVCQQYYAKKGIRSETTPLGPDGGIDIRLYQDDSGQPTAIVQCKAWSSKFVGVNLIRELLGVMTHEKIDKAFFMTTSRYSDDAKSFAQANRITLIDGPMLLQLIQRLPPTDRDSLLSFATDGDYRTPTCPTCGTKMLVRPGGAGRADFWGCQNYPWCKQTLGMRQG